MRTLLSATWSLLLLAASPCLAQNFTAPGPDESDLQAPTAVNPWTGADPGILVFHDNQRPFRLFEGVQIELSLWGGFETFWDVNPLFGTNPFLTPYGVQLPPGQEEVFFNPFNPFNPFAFPSRDFITSSGALKKPDSISRTPGLIGFMAEIRPYEAPLFGGIMYWSAGARFEIESQEDDFPFDRSSWYLQALGRIQSTPTFDEELAFQGTFLMGIGERTWINDGDFIFTVRAEIEGSARISADTRDVGYIRLGGRYAAEDDGVTAEMSADAQVGWKRLGLPTDFMNELRIYGMFKAAHRRDYERKIDLQQDDLLVGIGSQVRFGPVVFTAELGFYVYNEYELTPLRLPPELQGFENLFLANLFAGNLYNPIFTEIDTPGFRFVIGARLEF